MKIAIWQNVEFEGPGAIADWAKLRGHELLICKTHLGEELKTGDALIILGGPMSVYDNLEFLKLVKNKLKSYAIDGGKIYGICLGSQLIADALGAKVYSSHTREIGWRSVNFATHKITSGLNFEETVFHWHGDTFDLPSGAHLLASNDAFVNQAFCANSGKILATQFHFEATKASLEQVLQFDADYLKFTSPYINPDIMQQIHIERSNYILFKVLDIWSCL